MVNAFVLGHPVNILLGNIKEDNMQYLFFKSILTNEIPCRTMIKTAANSFQIPQMKSHDDL